MFGWPGSREKLGRLSTVLRNTFRKRRQFLRYFLKEITVIRRYICHSQMPTPDCTICIKVSQPGALRALPLYASSRNGNFTGNSSSNKKYSMASMKCVLILIVMLGIAYEALGASEDSYGRGLNNELQVARLLLLPPCLCHTKRNSELINSLLGLPKNMNNAGK